MHGERTKGEFLVSEQTVDEPRRPIRRALIGVSDKTGLLELATGLHAAGVEIVSTGGTARAIVDSGMPVTGVEEVTGFPESFDGRVKTLHPRVHAGLLADTGSEDHLAQLRDLDIAPFDLLVVNLYPFSRTVASGADEASCVENIDIGGPAMVRAAAKNHDNVAVVVAPEHYDWVLDQVRAGGSSLRDRKHLAARAYAHTASYDTAVAEWFAESYAPEDDSGFGAYAGASWQRGEVLRYGENPHQQAAMYTSTEHGLAHAEQLHGKAMSYNNYVDTDAARRAACDFDEPAVAIIKHANPCGIAVGTDLADAHRKAHACDPVSAFGGVIAVNRQLTGEAAEQISDVFTEVVLAPEFEAEALDILQRKKNIRLLRLSPLRRANTVEYRPISGGMLAQTIDAIDADGDDPANWQLATGQPADADTLADLAFAWRAGRAVKSNAILLASGRATVGVGMGQVNRVDAADLAVRRAGEQAAGSVAASDAFFPFPDGLEILTRAGVRAVVQPGGSVRDAEVTEAAEQAGITLYLTGTRHFYH